MRDAASAAHTGNGGAAPSAAPSSSPSAAPSASGTGVDAQRERFQAAVAGGANLVPLFERIFSDQLTPVLAYRCLVRAHGHLSSTPPRMRWRLGCHGCWVNSTGGKADAKCEPPTLVQPCMLAPKPTSSSRSCCLGPNIPYNFIQSSFILPSLFIAAAAAAAAAADCVSVLCLRRTKLHPIFFKGGPQLCLCCIQLCGMHDACTPACSGVA